MNDQVKVGMSDASEPLKDTDRGWVLLAQPEAEEFIREARSKAFQKLYETTKRYRTTPLEDMVLSLQVFESARAMGFIRVVPHRRTDEELDGMRRARERDAELSRRLEAFRPPVVVQPAAEAVTFNAGGVQ